MRFLLLVVVLLAGCTTAPPKPPPTTTPSADNHLTELLARPMRLPTLASGAACPITATRRHAPVAQPGDADGLGNGPVWPMTAGNLNTINNPTPGPDGLYEIKVIWATTGMPQGLVVVRVGRLDGPGHGLVRLYYEPAASHGDAVAFDVSGVPRDWPSGTFVSGPGCYAYQLDHRDGTDLLVFHVAG